MTSDIADFDRSYRAEFVRAARLAHLLTGSNDAAEDIAQEALLAVRTRIDSVDEPAAYLTTTVVNLCRNHHRSSARRAARELRITTLHHPGLHHPGLHRPGLHRPGDVESTSSEHDELLALVDGLPFRQRAVLVARYWLDMSEADIADLLDCRPGTVKSLASRAMATLRKELP